MVELKVSADGLGVYYIQIKDSEPDESIATDEFIAKELSIDYKDYVQILIEYGAFIPYSREYYFKTKKEAQKCADHFNKDSAYKEYYESENNNQLLPLGVMPESIFERQRVKELSRALFEYIDAGNEDYDMLIKWSEELQDRLQNLKFEKEEL